MEIELRYIGSRVSCEFEVDGYLKSLYQNVWVKINATEKKLIELFRFERTFEIKPFSFLIIKNKCQYEIGYDGVQFYKRKTMAKNSIKLPFAPEDLENIKLVEFTPLEKHRPKRDYIKQRKRQHISSNELEQMWKLFKDGSCINELVKKFDYTYSMIRGDIIKKYSQKEFEKFKKMKKGKKKKEK